MKIQQEKAICFSKIYEGTVRHRRFKDIKNEFSYKVFMMYVDLDEIYEICSLSKFWGTTRLALAAFRREDFYGDRGRSLKYCILDCVERSLGYRPSGAVRLLANFRYFGYIKNPLTTYYCYDENEELKAIVAEVNNTPWGERHAYVLSVDSQAKYSAVFDKEFHVSPFNPMDMQYHWYSNKPSDKVIIHLENWKNGTKVMDASLTLKARSISSSGLNMMLIRYPMMTVKVITAIYWQALRLWLKKARFYMHPNTARITES